MSEVMVRLTRGRIKIWRSLNSEDLEKELNEIYCEISKKFTFADIDLDTKREYRDFLCDKFQKASIPLKRALLACVRILFRDKYSVEEMVNDELSTIIIQAASLTEKCNVFDDFGVLMEAEMCLINGLFNAISLRQTFTERCCDSLLNRIELLNAVDEVTTCDDSYSAPNVFFLTIEQINQLAFYDLRISFVLTAYSMQLQSRWLSNGFDKFLGVVEKCLNYPEQLMKIISRSGDSTLKSFVSRANEALKTIFNLLSHADKESVNTSLCIRCITLCAKIIILENVEPSLEQAAVNILVTVPYPLNLLLTKSSNDSADLTDFEGYNMHFPDVLIKALNHRMDDENFEFLSSYFTVLINLCNQSKEVRRYCRLQIMPPLRATHVRRRPDVGGDMRNKLIRIMMGMSNCRQLAAELLFILCKKNVGRFMKYCGLGNAAGLLANYGLLGLINQPRSSSDSEESETEDYKEVEHMVNPITGYIEEQHENPVSMSEEQKEYETMKLVNTMSKLMDQGVISPCTIGDDGRIRPVEHILELTKKNVEINEDDDE